MSVSRILASSAAICASTMLLGGSPVAQADPLPPCGPDQATAVDVVLAHEPHEILTGRVFSPRPVASNYDPCANLSAILMTVDPPLSIPPPVQAMLFHRGTYMGKATMRSHAGTMLNPASTKDTVVLDFHFDDGRSNTARFHWDGARIMQLDPLPRTS